MALDELAFLFGLMLMQILYFGGMFSKVPPLANPKYFKPFLSITVVLAISGLSTIPYTTARPNLYLFLICPLYSFTLYQLLLLWFKHEHHRYPKVTYRERDPKLGWDEAFQFTYLFLATAVPIFLLGAFYP